MSKYEDIIQMIREQGGVLNQPCIEIAIMTGPKSCKIGDFTLEEQDLCFSEHLLFQAAIKVSVSESHMDKSAYLTPLKTGDVVAIQKLTETKYLVLAKVVGM